MRRDIIVFDICFKNGEPESSNLEIQECRGFR